MVEGEPPLIEMRGLGLTFTCHKIHQDPKQVNFER